MAWRFPEDREFDLEVKSGIYRQARLIEHDSDHLTLDYVGQLGIRVRAQVKIEDVTAVVMRVPVEDDSATALGVLVADA